jgi:hypothetical protein
VRRSPQAAGNIQQENRNTGRTEEGVLAAMAQVPQSNPAAGGRTAGSPVPTGWAGWIYFAGFMMLLLGGFQVVEGLVALFHNSYYLVTANRLLIHVNYGVWGWTLLIVGVIVAAAGFGVMVGQTWARVVGVIVAALSALVNLAFISAYPLWSVLVIALDVVVIYALTVHGRETEVPL